MSLEEDGEEDEARSEESDSTEGSDGEGGEEETKSVFIEVGEADEDRNKEDEA